MGNKGTKKQHKRCPFTCRKPLICDFMHQSFISTSTVILRMMDKTDGISRAANNRRRKCSREKGGTEEEVQRGKGPRCGEGMSGALTIHFSMIFMNICNKVYTYKIRCIYKHKSSYGLWTGLVSFSGQFGFLFRGGSRQFYLNLLLSDIFRLYEIHSIFVVFAQE